MLRKNKSFVLFISFTLFLCVSISSIFFLYISKYKKKFKTVNITLKSPLSSQKIPSLFFYEALSIYRDFLPSSFNIDSFHITLNKTGLFKKLKIKKLKNKNIIIKYETRVPLIQLGSQTNSFLDNQGVCFPSTPFFLPLNLPIFYPDQTNLSKIINYGDSVKSSDMTILNYLKPFFNYFSSIDLSKKSTHDLIIISCSNGCTIKNSYKNFYKEFEKIVYSSFFKGILTSTGLIIDLRVSEYVLVKALE